jgi:hypothetical protein
VYKLIEILLPKAMNKLTAKPDDANIKMVELWAQDASERKGWLKVVSLK